MVQLKSKPALLVVDMQNGFLHDNGSFKRLGIPIEPLRAAIPGVNRLAAFCRARGVPVIFVNYGYDPDFVNAGITLDTVPALKQVGGFVRGTWDAAMIDEIQPQRDDIVLEKTRTSAFWGTGLLEILRERGVDQLIVTGIATDVCVESTVRASVTEGVHAVVVSDATACLSEEEQKIAMKRLSWFGANASMDEIEEALRRAGG